MDQIVDYLTSKQVFYLLLSSFIKQEPTLLPLLLSDPVREGGGGIVKITHPNWVQGALDGGKVGVVPLPALSREAWLHLAWREEFSHSPSSLRSVSPIGGDQSVCPENSG